MMEKRDDRTYSEWFSDAVTDFVGSWSFIGLFSLLLGAWIAVNSLYFFEVIAFDPKPFILLNLILSFIAAYQAPFILMSQKRAEKKQDEGYRNLFFEIKELVEQDIQLEQEIHSLESDIKKELEQVKIQQARLLQHIQIALTLGAETRKDLAEIIELVQEEEES